MQADKKLDSVVTGIVLSSILAFYLLFLYFQTKNLYTGELPFEFKTTEHLVKSGFWQLFFLTLLNSLNFLIVHKRTNKVTQTILISFTLSSLLLLLSAGQRMYMYVSNYGFSYEKFYASYTVIYSFIILISFIYIYFSNAKVDIVKFGAYLFIWMYAISTIVPLELIMVEANYKLSRKEDSRINLDDLKYLSLDSLPLVNKYNLACSQEINYNKNIQTNKRLVRR